MKEKIKEVSRFEQKLRSDLDKNGFEVPDSRPLTIPVGFVKPDTLKFQIQELVRSELSRRAAAEGFESFEEADDFDTGEDEELRSPYELDDEMERASLSEFVDEHAPERTKVQPEPAQEPAQDEQEGEDLPAEPKATPKAGPVSAKPVPKAQASARGKGKQR